MLCFFRPNDEKEDQFGDQMRHTAPKRIQKASPGPPNWSPKAQKNVTYKRPAVCYVFRSKRREKNANLVTKWATRLPNDSKKRALGRQIGARKRRKT